MTLDPAARSYKEALGIKTGDIVTTSYGSGPYKVWSIHGPYLWSKRGHRIIFPWPAVSLELRYANGHHLFEKGGRPGINDIHRNENRWFDTMNDEIFINPPQSGYPNLPIDMFRSYPPEPEPYPFQAKVDYHAGHRQVWHCYRCGLDFNWIPTSDYGPPFCPKCNRVTSTRIILAIEGESTYAKTLG